MAQLQVLSGGAAQGLVGALAGQFHQKTGMDIGGAFGAVGVMQDKLLAGEPCDLLILSQSLIDGLVQSGHAIPASVRPVGAVKAGVAVVSGQPRPAIDTPEALRQALAQASAVYCPDPQKATAGIHFFQVLTQLGLVETLGERLRTYPNGATAMRELAASSAANPIGCTQVTEILFTPGVDLVGLLPPQFELATVYTAAVPVRAAHPALATRFIEMMTAADTAELRQRCGFEA